MNSLFLVLALAQADPLPPEGVEPAYPDDAEIAAWGEFARFSFGGGGSSLVRYGPLVRADDGVAHFWFHNEGMITREGRVGGWTNTLECPGTRDALAALSEVVMPTPDLPLLDDERPTVVADGSAYRIKVPASYSEGGSARITLESWGYSAPGVWVQSMFATLAPCWQQMPRETSE